MLESLCSVPNSFLSQTAHFVGTQSKPVISTAWAFISWISVLCLFSSFRLLVNGTADRGASVKEGCWWQWFPLQGMDEVLQCNNEFVVTGSFRRCRLGWLKFQCFDWSCCSCAGDENTAMSTVVHGWVNTPPMGSWIRPNDLSFFFWFMGNDTCVPGGSRGVQLKPDGPKT